MKVREPRLPELKPGMDAAERLRLAMLFMEEWSNWWSYALGVDDDAPMPAAEKAAAEKMAASLGERCCQMVIDNRRFLASAPPEALRIPEGWKLVPITPTGEMVDAGAETPGMKVIDGIVSTYQLRNGLRTIPELECDSSATSAIGKAYTAMVEAVRSPRGTK